MNICSVQHLLSPTIDCSNFLLDNLSLAYDSSIESKLIQVIYFFELPSISVAGDEKESCIVRLQLQNFLYRCSIQWKGDE